MGSGWGGRRGGRRSLGITTATQIKNVLRGFGGVGATQDDCNSEFPYLDNSRLSYAPPAVERIIALYILSLFSLIFLPGPAKLKEGGTNKENAVEHARIRASDFQPHGHVLAPTRQ